MILRTRYETKTVLYYRSHHCYSHPEFLIYTMLPKTLQSHKRADIVKLENTMEAIKTVLKENPNDLSFFTTNKENYHDGWAGPWYNRVKDELILLYYKEDSYGEFFIDTKDIWPATKVVLMASPINPDINFPGFNWDTTKIIRGK